jgi:hypothetical protein
MPQDPLQQPESHSSEQQPSAPMAVPVPQKTASPKLQQQLQQFWQRVQPVLTTQSVRALRLTIRALEAVVERLDTETPPQSSSPVSPVLDKLKAESLPPTSPDALPRVTTRVTTRVTKTPAIAPASTSSFMAQLRLIWQQLQGWWSFTLTKLRVILPTSLNRRLSDSALTGILLGLVVLTISTTSASSPEKTPAVAIAPPKITSLPSKTRETSPTPPTPDASSDLLITPNVTDTEPGSFTDTEPDSLTELDSLTEPEVEQPIAPLPSVVAEEPAPIPSPEPPLKLSPEQSLIAAIQEQVAAVSDQFANGLIESIQANFRSSRLIVRVGDDWYTLSRSRQDQLASEVLKRSQTLDFSKLEMTDRQGKLLARSPVVGSEMVILHRTLEDAKLRSNLI